MKIIGISGKMGTGKTTLANIIVGKIPGAIRMSFADPVREEVAELLGLVPDDVRDQRFKERTFKLGKRSMTGREILQWWGTEIRRKADCDYWVSIMARRLSSLHDSYIPIVVIDDVRFRSEAQIIPRLIRLDPYPGWAPGPNANHPSETDLDNWGSFQAAFSPVYGTLADVADRILYPNK
jgi:hypothetical protein